MQEHCHYGIGVDGDKIGGMFGQETLHLSIFKDFSADDWKILSPYLGKQAYAQGERIFEQGHPAVALYILLCGEVLVTYKPYDGPVLSVAQIMPGGVFGWSAALGREVYTSSASMAVAGSVFLIRASALQRLREAYPQTGKLFIERLADSIADRLRSTNSSVVALLNQQKS